ncbi:DNA-binding NarL/FixJ family response regulator [Pedobacter sp. AK013]|uniref:response regulator n=1 Tax=Pedobacter sp. AK013 TaxID=2723071 RepID=UPI0016163E56|nr:response regulator [Pedobacter sp. AK013]MBB6236948.1 DNA-binding NarL/FixJ family response regulator [Pedobacter sp. AK013]
MFQKVLIAEDHEGMNYSMQVTLENLGIEHDFKNYVFYCDDALSRIHKAKSENKPYELLITDLSFNEDFPKQQITDGARLIKAVKEVQPEIKILVFSSEGRLSEAQILFESLNIDGFVPKGRGDVKDLKSAIQAIFDNKKYISANLKKTINEKVYDFEKLDIAILTLLAKGISQKMMQAHLQEMGIKPNSLSSIEKQLKKMREALEFQNNPQLIAYCIDRKII